MELRFAITFSRRDDRQRREGRSTPLGAARHCHCAVRSRMEILPGIYPAFSDCQPVLDPTRGSRLSGPAPLHADPRRRSRSAEAAQMILFSVGIYAFPTGKRGSSAARPSRPWIGLRDWFRCGVLIAAPRGQGARPRPALKGATTPSSTTTTTGFLCRGPVGEHLLIDPGAESTRTDVLEPSLRERPSQLLWSSGARVAVSCRHGGRRRPGRRTEFTDRPTAALDIRLRTRSES